MLEARPGIGVDRFMAAFVRESKAKLHPWVTEYDRAARVDTLTEREAERLILEALRDVAKVDFVLRYDAASRRLTLTRTTKKSIVREAHREIEFAFVPLLLTDRPDSWRALTTLSAGASHYDDVGLEQVTAFVAVRARGDAPAIERIRLVLGKLELPDDMLDQRDELVRRDVLANADPAVVLNALMRGLAHIGNGVSSVRSGAHAPPGATRQLFLEADLERVLQVLALAPDLVQEMRLLLGPAGGEEFHRFCDDLDHALRQVREELI